MSMKELVDRDCGGANPLMKLTSHFTQDLARKEDLRGARGATAFVPKPFGQAHEEELVTEFLHNERGSHPMAPGTFHMGELMRQVQNLDHPKHFNQPVQSSQWVDDYLSSRPKSSNQVINPGANINAIQPMHHVSPMPAFQSHSNWENEYIQTVGLDDEKIESSDPTELQKAALDLAQGMKDERFEYSEFKNFLENRVAKESEADLLKETDWNKEFLKGQERESDTWAKEFESSQKAAREMTEPADGAAYWDKLTKEWDDLMKSEEGEHPWLNEFENFEPAKYNEYNFEEDNPLLEHPAPFEEGLKRLKEGDISNAVLLFEAAVQKDSNHVEAWQYLGTTMADNEQEVAAIAALKKCLEIQPNNLTALLALAVSYTNESLQSKACEALERWLFHNEKYRGLVPELGDHRDASSYVPLSKRDKIKNLYIQAVRQNSAQIDPDVQIGLGIIFNLTGEYDKAVDCFQAALQIRDGDALLWNKLGATLANSGKSEQSIEAYSRALNLAPGYVRTRFNLGVACINLSAYKEAVEHFLAALNLQHNSKGPKGERTVTSENIWTTLRLAVSLQGRSDMYEACDQRKLDVLNKEYGVKE
ncbi:DgyrCDS5271 [Dimorphilus gyrociliatus]|uniref:DgyrCDS5271 n=1 Tax=Dimorphilus gyrociliatus TaxID=2664684 RepID=A0A7I8VJB4_9ANNE|nr:DgyrCDS5271 [Dimorphilus gyrociliatus]